MRYAYLKNGDAVAQVERYLAGTSDRSGPDAFIGDFLGRRRDDDVLVLCRADRSARTAGGRISAVAVAGPRWLALAALRRLWAAIAIALRIWRWRPDRVLIGCSGELFWFALLAARLVGAPVVNSRHGGLPGTGLAGRIKLALERRALASCHGVVCHGPYLAAGIRGIGIPAPRIREFEVDLRDFGLGADAEPVPPELEEFLLRYPAIVMYVGRIQTGKGPLDLLDAYRLLPDEIAGKVGLVFVGDGGDMPELRRRVSRTPDAPILLMGRVPHHRLAPIMARATVIAAPTQPQLPEGRCMVVLEAMVLGVPVVAPDFAAFPYAVNSGSNGLLFQPGDVPALSAALARIVANNELRATLSRGALSSSRSLIEGAKNFGESVDAAFA